MSYPASNQDWKFSRQKLKYVLPLQSGNLHLEQTKFPVFWQNFQNSLFSLTGNFLGHFPCFPCAVGTLPLTYFHDPFPHPQRHPSTICSDLLHVSCSGNKWGDTCLPWHLHDNNTADLPLGRGHTDNRQEQVTDSAVSSSPTSRLKAHTHRPIFRGIIAESAVESADSIPESADSTTDFTIVGRLSISNMFNISTPTQSADFSRPTIAVGGLQIGLVGMGLKRPVINYTFFKKTGGYPDDGLIIKKTTFYWERVGGGERGFKMGRSQVQNYLPSRPWDRIKLLAPPPPPFQRVGRFCALPSVWPERCFKSS